MERPVSVHGQTTRLTTGCGKIYGTISNLEETYQEIFLRMGKQGGCALCFLDSIARLISLGMNQTLTRDLVVRAFIGMRCPNPTFDGPIQILSCPDAIAQWLRKEEKTDDH